MSGTSWEKMWSLKNTVLIYPTIFSIFLPWSGVISVVENWNWPFISSFKSSLLSSHCAGSFCDRVIASSSSVVPRSRTECPKPQMIHSCIHGVSKPTFLSLLQSWDQLKTIMQANFLPCQVNKVLKMLSISLVSCLYLHISFFNNKKLAGPHIRNRVKMTFDALN